MIVRYYGAARAAVGRVEETLNHHPATLNDLIAELLDSHQGTTAAGTPLSEILPMCSFLADGKYLEPAASLSGVSKLEVLPPFCGG